MYHFGLLYIKNKYVNLINELMNKFVRKHLTYYLYFKIKNLVLKAEKTVW